MPKTRTHASVRHSSVNSAVRLPAICDVFKKYTDIFIYLFEVNSAEIVARWVSKGVTYLRSQHFISIVFLLLVDGFLSLVFVVSLVNN